jgi:ATP:ADP antiporter, AAA family
MSASEVRDHRAARAAMLAAAAMIASQIAGKAARDGLFLSVFPVTTLPAVLVGTGVISAAVALGWGRLLRTRGPARLVPAAFVASGALFLGLWPLTLANAHAGAIATYGLVAIMGPILISSYWSLINERFDARTAKRTVARIGATATLGGVAGGVLAERLTSGFGVAATLPALAVLQLVCAYAARGISPEHREPVSNEPDRPFTGLRILAGSPYLLTLASLVIVGAVAAAMLDFLFKAAAADLYRSESSLVRVFSIFHMGSSLLTFVFQSVVGHRLVERLGIARSSALLPAAISVSGVVGAVFPGFTAAAAAWTTDHVLRNSAFRSAHELFFTPIPAREKRATKTLVDVASSRVGDIVGGALAGLLLAVAGASARTGMWWACVVLGALGTWIALRLHRGYVATLERNLLQGAVAVEDVGDAATRSVVLKTQAIRITPALRAALAANPNADPMNQSQSVMLERPPSGQVPLTPVDIAHTVLLLGQERHDGEAMRALRAVASTAVGQLGDALLDSRHPPVIRRRVARLLGTTGSRRAVDALLQALEDAPFNVRHACGIALARIRAEAPDVIFDRDRVFAAVHREVDVERKVWVAQAESAAGDETGPNPISDFLRQRASASLEHVFNLLSLVLAQRPLQIAFRGLSGDDRMLRGMGLEYLESVLPPPIRDRLWEFLEEDPRRSPTQRGKGEVVADLLRSHESIRIRISELRKEPGS